MKRFTMIGMVLALVLMTGCTDAFMGKVSAYGGSANVKCYSGTMLIYDGDSTGKVQNSQQSDGYYFVDRKDNKLKEISGNCIVTYNSY